MKKVFFSLKKYNINYNSRTGCDELKDRNVLCTAYIIYVINS